MDRVMLCAKGEWPALPRMPEGWLFEPKLDGTRILAGKRDGAVSLTNRRGARKEAAFPEVAGALRSIPGDFLLDGELCCSSFSTLAARDHLTDPTRIRLLSRLHPATLHVFDILRRDSSDLTGLPLRRRKEELADLLRDLPPRVALVLPGARGVLAAMAERGEIEGVVAKDPDSPYEFRRSPRWVKFRREETEDLPVVGFEESDRPGRPLRSLICLRDGREVGVASGLSASDLEAVARAIRSRPHREARGEGGRKRIYLVLPSEGGEDLRRTTGSGGAPVNASRAFTRQGRKEGPLPVAEVSFYNDPSMAIRFPRFVRFKEAG